MTLVTAKIKMAPPTNQVLMTAMISKQLNRVILKLIKIGKQVFRKRAHYAYLV